MFCRLFVISLLFSVCEVTKGKKVVQTFLSSSKVQQKKCIKLNLNVFYGAELTSLVFSLEPIFLKISDRMSLTLAFDIRSSWEQNIITVMQHNSF